MEECDRVDKEKLTRKKRRNDDVRKEALRKRGEESVQEKMKVAEK